MLPFSVLTRQTWLHLAVGTVEDQVVAGVWPAKDGPPSRGGGLEDWTDILAVVGPGAGDLDRLLSELVRSGAAGVVTAGTATEALMSAALQCGLPCWRPTARTRSCCRASHR